MRGQAGRQAAETADAFAGEAGVESAEKALFRAEQENAQNHKSQNSNELYVTAFCGNSQFWAFSTDSLGKLECS
jgi:hypothetical protein